MTIEANNKMFSSAQRLDWDDVPLARLPMPKGEMTLTRSLTSGLCRRASDPHEIFWGVGDRGPNISPADGIDLYGLTGLEPWRDLDGAKVLPMPDTGPALARFRLEGSRVLLEAVMPLRAPDGRNLGGLPPVIRPDMENEPVFGVDGTRLGINVDGADCEGIVARPDGRFWVSEEYGPALLLVTEEGEVQRRLVPMGLGADYQSSTVPTQEILPAIARMRKLNRGFEALALSSDGARLYVAFQSPLAHPDRTAHDNGDIVRIWALDAESGAFIEEYAYPLDMPEQFERDCEAGAVERSDIKVSEMTCLADDSLLVLERITHSTKIYRITLNDKALPHEFVEMDHRPTLEQLNQQGLLGAGHPLLQKQLLLSTDAHRMISCDLEGMIVLDDGALLLANDSDYGISGASTEFWRVSRT